MKNALSCVILTIMCPANTYSPATSLPANAVASPPKAGGLARLIGYSLLLAAALAAICLIDLHLHSVRAVADQHPQSATTNAP